MCAALLKLNNLSVHFAARGGEINAVDRVSFTLEKGESLGWVGESGSGKTTLARALLRLLPPEARIHGHACFEQVDLVELPEATLRTLRGRRIVMLFQATSQSLNPAYRIGEQIVEVIVTHIAVMTAARAAERMLDLLDLAGLRAQFANRYPHELNEQQRQRAALAMALACTPDLILSDAFADDLDALARNSLLRTLKHIQAELNIAAIYFSRDIHTTAQISERIGVMHAARLIELGRSTQVLRRPRHPYTHALIHATPGLHGPLRELDALPDKPIDPAHPPGGCRFHPRCARRIARCSAETPTLRHHAGGHYVACWNPFEAGD
jgi:peptide/nickel transport system ATP-binding protein